MERVKLIGTTAADGSATIVSTRQVFGKLVAVQWVDGDLVDNHTGVLSVVNSEHPQTLLNVGAGEGNVDAWYYPKKATCDQNCTALTDYAQMVIEGRLQLVIAAGGDSKTGGCYVFLE